MLKKSILKFKAMLFFLIAFFVFSFCLSTVNAATWAQKGINTHWDHVTMSSDGKFQTAVGHPNWAPYPQIYVSSDYGNTWAPKGPSTYWFDVVMSSDGKIQAAAGDTIYISTDFGNTWAPVGAGGTTFGSVLGGVITMSKDGKVIATTGFGVPVTYSTDYGTTWTRSEARLPWGTSGQTQSASFWDLATSADGKLMLGLIINGVIYKSTDYGSTWTLEKDLNNPALNAYAIAMSADGKVQTVVDNNANTGQKIYVSTDYGNTWAANGPGTGNRWYDVAMSADGKTQLALPFNSPNIYTSTDYGATWTSQSIGSGPYYWWGAAVSDDGSVLAAADAGGAGGGYIYVSSSSTPPSTICTPNWQTGQWSTCANSQQSRTVTDSNNCGVTTDRPALTQSCNSVCTPNWSCSNWSTCANNQQAKTCTDLNGCGVTTNRPELTQTCSTTTTCATNWSCSAWSTCANGLQSKTCTDTHSCGVLNDRPSLTQSCSTTTNPNPPVGDIATLQNQLSSLQQQLRAAQGGTSTTLVKPTITFGRTLNVVGAKGDDVKALQQFLNNNGFKVATSGAGSPGFETSIFGLKTKQALYSFQQAHSDQILKPLGLTKPTGTFGPSTRNFINSLK